MRGLLHVRGGCPAECITIEAGEHPKVDIEKYPVVFEIDMLRCVFCGYCVDACPEEAIMMTRNYDMAYFTREQSIVGDRQAVARPGLPVKDGLGYRPYYPGDGTRPPGDSSSSPVIPGDGERAKLREKGLDIHHTEGPGPLNASSPATAVAAARRGQRGQTAAAQHPMVKS